MRNYTKRPNKKHLSFTKYERSNLDYHDKVDFSNINILIVDDRPENLLAIEAVIGNFGYQLIRANSGEEALKWILKKDFAVIILDVQMPGLNGFETAKMIKSRPSSSHIPIIFMTAINQTAENVKEGFSVGAIDYIFKPFDPVHLKSKVIGFVNIYQNQQQIKHQREMLKKHSEELEKANLNLEKIIQERTQELIEVNQSLQNEIIERNHIAQQLQRSNHKLISVLDSIGDAFFSIDNNRHFTYVNKEFEAYIGVSQKFLIGKSLLEVITKLHPTVEEKLTSVMTMKAQAHFEVYEETVHRWYEYRIYPFEKGASVYFGDITHRKLMERNLRLSQERFYKVFESSPNLIAIISLDGCRYVDVNSAWILNTGYPRDEVVGYKGNILQMKSVDSNEYIDGMGIDNCETIRNEKIYFKTKSNDMRQGLLSRELIEIDGEKCVISAVTDITERVLLEKEMTRLDRFNLIGEMAAGIAHEIRNPMTTVRGFLQVAKDNPSSQYFDLMIDELDRANEIITEYLTLAKNKITNQTTQQINQLIKALHPLIKAEATLTNKEILLELGECPDLQLDEKEIRQMLLNLCLNGLEAMESGGTLTIKTYSSSNEVTLEVIDEGTGIDKEILEKIGTPFFTTKEKGTGLGLSVCYSVANRHKAVIDVDSSEKGTTFRVQFCIL